MQNRDAAAEPVGESADGLRRQGDFGNQDDSLLSPVDTCADCVQIDFCLAASGNSVQQHGLMVRTVHRLNDRIDSV